MSYLITIMITIFITSIITEHLVIQHLKRYMGPGVAIKNGQCKLKDGYGQLEDQPPQKTPQESQVEVSNSQAFNNENSKAPKIRRAKKTSNKILDDFYRPLVD
jgi:hypothetical protein